MAGCGGQVFGVFVLVVFTVFSDALRCTVKVEDLEYDLSPLSEQDYWHTLYPEHDGSMTVMYFSLCHPLRGAPPGCGSGNNTGVCVTKEHPNGTVEIIVANAGRVSSESLGPSGGYASHRMVEYLMKDGLPCPHRSGDTYRTHINFMCDHSSSEVTEPVIMNQPGCQILVAWMTPYACPRRLDVVPDTSCTIQYPLVDHKLNLQTLRHQHFYNTSSAQPRGKYEVNICGSVTNGSCGGEDVAVCYVAEGQTPTVLATTKDMKVRWEDEEVLILAYQRSTSGRDVDIKFVCDRSGVKTAVNYMSQNDTAVVLGVRTAAVCTPIINPSCVLEDHSGNVYDLRPLHRIQDNWEVFSVSKQRLFYFNLCGPLNPDKHYKCPSGLLGACMVDIGGDAAYNLGLLTSEPIIDSNDGTITILYTGGDTCKGGQHSHSTRINLICGSVEEDPIHVRDTDTCEHVFDWFTPAACIRHLTAGTNCTVSDPLYGNVYDLNPLRNSHKDYKVTNNGNYFLINVCGPLVSSCNGETGKAGVCQGSEKQQFNAGLYTSNITFNDGTLMTSYTSDTHDCEGNNTRSSQIIYLCDHESSGRDGPMSYPHNGCTNTFFWKTKYACPSFYVVDCILYTTDGKMYDLQELSKPDSNLEYFNGDQKFVLNVCRSVVHQKGSRCAYRAGACIVDLTHNNNSVNIGEVQSGPYLEDGKLILRYAGGEQCDGHTEQQYQTVMEFICDKNETFAYPHFITEENCTYYFQVSSAAACPVSIDNTKPPLVGKDCAVTSPTGYVFNLTLLKGNTDYVVKGSKNTTFSLNVCAPLKNPECQGEGVGICSKNINAGQANANLHYLPEHLSLKYTGGDECSHGIRRSTIITFVCGAENVMEGPAFVFDDEDSCMYFITWYTELACNKRIPCFVDTYNHRIDLSPLIRSTGNYETVNPQNPKEKFYLNVCRPLNPITGLNCRPGSAVCVSGLSGGSHPLSLGHPDITPAPYGSNGASIMYKHGAKCPSNPGYTFSSKIDFLCDLTKGKGSPVFRELTHDCQYQFEWRTSAACDTVFIKEDPGPQCQIWYDKAKTHIDLRPLHRPEGYQVKSGSKTFTVNVCGPACNMSGTCSSDGDSYGLSSKSELEWQYSEFKQHSELKLQYYDGSVCNGHVSGYKGTIIFFVCDMSAGFGFPVVNDLTESHSCKVIFDWKTNVTCIEGIYGTQDTPQQGSSSNNTMQHDGSKVNTSQETSSNNTSKDSLKSETSSKSSTASAVIATVFVVSGLIFIAALVVLKSRQGNHIVAATRKLFGIHRYNSNRTSVEDSSLLGVTNSVRVFRADDSDDDLLRV